MSGALKAIGAGVAIITGMLILISILIVASGVHGPSDLMPMNIPVLGFIGGILLWYIGDGSQEKGGPDGD